MIPDELITHKGGVACCEPLRLRCLVTNLFPPLRLAEGLDFVQSQPEQYGLRKSTPEKLAAQVCPGDNR